MKDDAIERALAEVLGPEGAVQPGDHARLEKLIDAALSTPVAPPPTKLAIKLAIAGGGILAGAALILWMHDPKHVPAAIAPATIAPIESASAPSPEIVQVTEPPVVSATAVPSAPPAVPGLSAERLFSRANDARRKGHDGDAIDDYRTLQRTFSASPEAVASHVALGRLLLDKRGNAAAALQEFDRYLATQSGGTLDEEALIGRALSLGRLGREDEARRAWQRLLDTHPDSIYADQARAHVAPH